MARLRSSVPPYLRATAPAARLQTFIPPRLHDYSVPLELRALCLHVATLIARLPAAILSSLHIEPLDLHPSMPSHRYTCSAPLDLYTNMPPRFHAPACLQSSRAPYVYAHTTVCPSARPALHTFIPLHRYGCRAYPDLHASTSACVQRASRASVRIVLECDEHCLRPEGRRSRTKRYRGVSSSCVLLCLTLDALRRLRSSMGGNHSQPSVLHS